MEYINLFNGEKIDKKYFEETLSELLNENWSLRPISELPTDHVNCLLSFITISKNTTEQFYESDKHNIVSVEAYNQYIKPKIVLR